MAAALSNFATWRPAATSAPALPEWNVHNFDVSLVSVGDHLKT
jgi:hypothetical protein